jgi:uncharacterized protein YlxW (UPF0749 family)
LAFHVRTGLTALVAALAGILFISSSVTSAGTNLRTAGVEDLRRYVIDRAQSVGILQARVDKADQEVASLSAKYIDQDLQQQLAALENATGMNPATGTALVVELNDAPRLPGAPLPEGAVPDDLVVHQQDVQSVVNALWRGGATAISVMDQRIITSSAIRCVGNTLLLQGRVYSPPFKVTAIGDVAALQTALDNEPGVAVYQQYVERYGLGWNVSIVQELTMPAWVGVAQ